MKIVSIDIGIKNLSFCYIDLNIITKTYDIILWDVVNLLNEEQKICTSKIVSKKQNKICNNKATYSILNNFCCKKHLGGKPIANKESINIIKNQKFSQKTYNALKKQFNLEKYEKSKHDLILEDLLIKIKENYSIPLNKLKSANDVDLIEIGINIKSKLDKIFLDREIEIILIENQISTLASRMKTIQGMVAQYFINNNKINIKFISSKNKLKNYNVNQKTYNERKKSSIEITKKILDETPTISRHKEFFNKNKKKDDLADSFLQGLWYINTIIT